MKNIFLFLVFTFSFISSYSQKMLKIKGCIRDIPYSKIYLASLYGGKMAYLDSAIVNNNCFDFYINDTIPKGLYNIVMNRHGNAYMRIIINNENIEFTSVFSRLLDSMSFSSSLENKLYYDYTKLFQKGIEKTELLKKLLNLYPSSTSFNKSILAEIKQAGLAANKKAVELFTKYPDTYASAYIKAQQPVAVPASMNSAVYLKQHFLDNVDFSNTSLLHSDIFTVSILNYLALFENNKNTYREQVEGYARALDNIMIKASSNKEVFAYYQHELTDRYRYGNYDILGAYLMEYYPTIKQAETKYLSTDVSSRLAKLKTISVGKQAPAIIMPTYDGKNMSLSDIQSDYTLLVFWSTGCFYCTEMLPALKQLYDKKKVSLEVLAISFDTNKGEWEDFIRKGGYSWLNYSDMEGFNSVIAKNYQIQGTPTFLLLNKDKTVIYKPATLDELVSRLKGLNII